MLSPVKWWNERREKVSFGLITFILTGKLLVVLGLSVYTCPYLKPYGLHLLIAGTLLNLGLNIKWLGKLPSGNPVTLWEENRGKLHYMMLDGIGLAKGIAVLGMGQFFSTELWPYRWALVALGIVMVLIGGTKYLKL